MAADDLESLFYHKNTPDFFPDRITRATVERVAAFSQSTWSRSAGNRRKVLLRLSHPRTGAHRLAEDHPKLLTVEQRKNKRGDRIFLDVARNAYAQTMATPYSVRARPGAPVATPIERDELDEGDS